jgi:hypothetical protein
MIVRCIVCKNYNASKYTDMWFSSDTRKNRFWEDSDQQPDEKMTPAVKEEFFLYSLGDSL